MLHEETIKYLRQQLLLRRNAVERHTQMFKFHAGLFDLRTANAAMAEAEREAVVANDIEMILARFV